jgi:ribosomal protein L36
VEGGQTTKMSISPNSLRKTQSSQHDRLCSPVSAVESISSVKSISRACSIGRRTSRLSDGLGQIAILALCCSFPAGRCDYSSDGDQNEPSWCFFCFFRACRGFPGLERSPNEQLLARMKYRSTLKRICALCRIVTRNRRVYVTCENRRHKQKQYFRPIKGRSPGVGVGVGVGVCGCAVLCCVVLCCSVCLIVISLSLPAC